MKIKRNPQGGVYAQVIGKGRVWVDSINSLHKTAFVRFDPGDGTRSPQKKVNLSDIDFGYIGWDGWRSI